ncbi:LuxR C-terminal-related transcriptional regulator [Flavobacterium sediminilitoris]|uniref:LuxR C-terminal-related transcriptional regulator n=1 Tax=Flavobacterium sediminilitoris TaxID=2024526 RepID=A0ABY4HMY8_9FLAO|nr:MULTISPECIES: LuxR C-terminal-related transcriptional regulator [Flavobacterium]UOX33607.1 LuxR C-terminal-related transcriptional regulator [Flavobacterium sediminilitoris]
MKNYIFLLFIITVKLFGQNNTQIIPPKKLSPSEIYTKEYDFIDEEEQKFEKFKRQIKAVTTEDYLEKIRTYSKDSLKTLAIKLLSLKELNEKKLLQKDISLNSEYYIRLLEELKSSEINNQEYFFLEKELNSYYLINLEKKQTFSIILNIIFGIIIAILIYTIYSLKSQKRLNIIEELSNQEIKIKEHILNGKSNKEIAEELFISLNTVKTHITNIYSKLNVSNRKELINKFQK